MLKIARPFIVTYSRVHFDGVTLNKAIKRSYLNIVKKLWIINSMRGSRKFCQRGPALTAVYLVD